MIVYCLFGGGYDLYLESIWSTQEKALQEKLRLEKESIDRGWGVLQDLCIEAVKLDLPYIDQDND